MPFLLKTLLESSQKTMNDIQKLTPLLVRAAQEVYNEWNQDEEGMDAELGGGGICQDIADAISGVLSNHGIEVTTVDSGGMGEQHVWAVARVKDGIFGVDIDYRRYEVGSGYNWKKRLGVVFDNSDIEIYKMDIDWEDLTGGY